MCRTPPSWHASHWYRRGAVSIDHDVICDPAQTRSRNGRSDITGTGSHSPRASLPTSTAITACPASWYAMRRSRSPMSAQSPDLDEAGCLLPNCYRISAISCHLVSSHVHCGSRSRPVVSKRWIDECTLAQRLRGAAPNTVISNSDGFQDRRLKPIAPLGFTRGSQATRRARARQAV